MLRALRAFRERVVVDKIDLATDKGLDAVFLPGLKEINRPEKISVIRKRQSLHPQTFSLLKQPIDPTSPIQEAIVSVDM